mgnify:CR=1 FL=1
MFNFKLLSGDNKTLQESLGNSVGGTLRCSSCNFDFGDKKKCFNYSFITQNTQKTFKVIFDYWKEKYNSTSLNNDIGLTRVCPFLGASKEDFLKLSDEQIISFLNICTNFDVLHNNVGHAKKIIKYLKKIPGWNDEIFMEKMFENVKRRLVSELDGAHVRLLFAHYKKIFYPAIDQVRSDIKKKIKQMLKNWTEIEWISHLAPQFQKEKVIRLRLHGITLPHLLLIRSIFPINSTNTIPNINLSELLLYDCIPPKLYSASQMKQFLIQCFPSVTQREWLSQKYCTKKFKKLKKEEFLKILEEISKYCKNNNIKDINSSINFC